MTDEVVKPLMCSIIRAFLCASLSLIPSVSVCSSHQCTLIKSSSAEEAACRLDAEHFLWVQVSVITTDRQRFIRINLILSLIHNVFLIIKV